MNSLRLFTLRGQPLPKRPIGTISRFSTRSIIRPRTPKLPRWNEQELRAIDRRYASTTQTAARETQSIVVRLKNLLYGTSLVLFLFVGYYTFTDTRFKLQKWIIVPGLRYFYPDAEEAHHMSISALKNLHILGLHPRERVAPEAAGDLQVEIFGHTLSNPVGISAGLDKGAEIPDQLFLLGPAYVEVGGITPLPQDGNPKPRLFRIPSQDALINRFGLNSEGADHVAMRLRQRVRQFAYAMGYGVDDAAERFVLDGGADVPPGSLAKGRLMGVQIAKNKATSDDVEAVVRDYVYCVEKLAKYADVIVVNVSSPNTENLRDLQRQEPLTQILKAVVDASKRTDRKTKPSVMVKVSPDEDSDAQVGGVCQAILDSNVDGVIVANTTKARPDPVPLGYQLEPNEVLAMQEQGGYSGPQLFERSVRLVRRYRDILDRAIGDELSRSNRKVIFCSGGITNGQQALAALKAGADLVQVYTALIYGGPGTVTQIKSEIRTELAQNS